MSYLDEDDVSLVCSSCAYRLNQPDEKYVMSHLNVNTNSEMNMMRSSLFVLNIYLIYFFSSTFK